MKNGPSLSGRKTSRRRLVELALAAGSTAALPLTAVGAPTELQVPLSNPMFPARYLKVLGFFNVDADFYEKVHAVDFMSFAAPYMARYARNWIKDVEAGQGPSDITVVTEIRYKSEAAKANVQRLMFSAAGEVLLRHTNEHRAARTQAAAAQSTATSAPVQLFSVAPQTLSAAATGTGPSVMQRRLLLLRRPNGISHHVFESAAIAFAREIMATGNGIDTSIDVFGENPQAGPANAVVYVARSDSAALSVAKNRALQVVGILRVETHSSIG